MGKMDKTEKYTVAGLCFGGSGVFLCEDAVVCARVYGYCDGTVVEFCLGIACIVIATVSLYIAGMLRDRRIQAEFARRHAERERPLRAISASGERVALAASETVPAGTVLEFSILVMNPKDAETVREWLDYGALRGLFQWRNSGKGRFEWDEVG